MYAARSPRSKPRAADAALERSGDRQHLIRGCDIRWRQQYRLGAPKAVIDAATKSLARVLGPNIRVVSVSTGAVDGGFVPGRTTETVERATHAAQARGGGRRGGAHGALPAVTLMTATTGSILLVEGGSLL